MTADERYETVKASPCFVCAQCGGLGTNAENEKHTRNCSTRKGNPCECPARKALESIHAGVWPLPSWASRDLKAALAAPCPFGELRTELESALRVGDQLLRERDEAFRVRDLAREASNRDLEAKRAAEAEKDRLGLSYCALEAQYENACQIIREERPQAEQFRADLAEALAALQNIRKFPALPFPDPMAHSWRAFGEAVHRAYCDMQRVAATVLAKHGEHWIYGLVAAAVLAKHGEPL